MLLLRSNGLFMSVTATKPYWEDSHHTCGTRFGLGLRLLDISTLYTQHSGEHGQKGVCRNHGGWSVWSLCHKIGSTRFRGQRHGKAKRHDVHIPYASARQILRAPSPIYASTHRESQTSTVAALCSPMGVGPGLIVGTPTPRLRFESARLGSWSPLLLFFLLLS
jgi:hypothetical protein